MRHRQKGKTLDRASQPRALMLRNLAASVLLYEKVTTTNARGKAVRSIVERAITVGKVGTISSRRKLLQVLPVKNAVVKVMEDLAPRYKDRKGGYTRIIKLPRRLGDAAERVRIELV